MKIYDFLKKNTQATVSQLVKVVGLTQPTVSYHLGEMKKAGLLSDNKVGKQVYYSIKEGCETSSKSCVLHNVEFFYAKN